jgi:hypothetical protein
LGYELNAAERNLKDKLELSEDEYRERMKIIKEKIDVDEDTPMEIKQAFLALVVEYYDVFS